VTERNSRDTGKGRKRVVLYEQETLYEIFEITEDERLLSRRARREQRDIGRCPRRRTIVREDLPPTDTRYRPTEGGKETVSHKHSRTWNDTHIISPVLLLGGFKYFPEVSVLLCGERSAAPRVWMELSATDELVRNIPQNHDNSCKIVGWVSSNNPPKPEGSWIQGKPDGEYSWLPNWPSKILVPRLVNFWIDCQICEFDLAYPSDHVSIEVLDGNYVDSSGMIWPAQSIDMEGVMNEDIETDMEHPK
jgi:hypothetical protein